MRPKQSPAYKKQACLDQRFCLDMFHIYCSTYILVGNNRMHYIVLVYDSIGVEVYSVYTCVCHSSSLLHYATLTLCITKYIHTKVQFTGRQKIKRIKHHVFIIWLNVKYHIMVYCLISFLTRLIYFKHIPPSTV